MCNKDLSFVKWLNGISTHHFSIKTKSNRLFFICRAKLSISRSPSTLWPSDLKCLKYHTMDLRLIVKYRVVTTVYIHVWTHRESNLNLKSKHSLSTKLPWSWLPVMNRTEQKSTKHPGHGFLSHWQICWYVK